MGVAKKYGAPGEIRTPDRLVRSQVLYPAELRARVAGHYRVINLFSQRLLRRTLMVKESETITNKMLFNVDDKSAVRVRASLRVNKLAGEI